MTLQDKVALVTGGSRGIGRAICRGLASQGAKVVVAARTEEDISSARPRKSDPPTSQSTFSVRVGWIPG